MALSDKQNVEIDRLFRSTKKYTNVDIAQKCNCTEATVRRRRKEWEAEQEHPPSSSPPPPASAGEGEPEIDRSEMPRKMVITSFAADIAANPESTAPQRDAAWDGADRSMAAFMAAEKNHKIEMGDPALLLSAYGIYDYLGDWAKSPKAVGIRDERKTPDEP